MGVPIDAGQEAVGPRDDRGELKGTHFAIILAHHNLPFTFASRDAPEPTGFTPCHACGEFLPCLPTPVPARRARPGHGR